MLSSDRQDNQKNNESITVVDHVPPTTPSVGLFPVTVVDGVVAVENSSQSTPSWDFAESISSTGIPIDNSIQVIEKRTTSLRVAELEQQIALLKSQVESLRAENIEKFNVIQDQMKVIEELEKFRDGSGEMSDGFSTKATLLVDREAKIQQLKKEQENEALEDVIVDVFEEEEKSKKLMIEKHQASLVVKVLLDINLELLGSPAKLPIESFHSEPSGLFQTLVKGAEVLEMDLLLEFAQAFASRALEVDSKWVVAFLSTFLANKPDLYSKDPVATKCLKMIRSDPTLLLESNKVSILSAECIKMLLKDPTMQTDELTLFRVLLQWYSGSQQNRKEVSHGLVQYIALELINPVELSTTVRSSGFVSDSMLCDAYGKQAMNKDLAKGNKIRTAPEYTNAKWDALDSDVLIGKPPHGWSIGTISSRVMKDIGFHTWDMILEESGEVIFAVSNALKGCPRLNSFNHQQFMPQRFIEKGSFVSCQLFISRGVTRSLSLSINGYEFVSDLKVQIDGDLTVTVCVRKGAAVKFVGFKPVNVRVPGLQTS
jgi:hypothetical protein